MTAANAAAYEVIGVGKTYPGASPPANVDLHLKIDSGDVLGLLGDNGAGKTTLVQQMVGLQRPSAGRVLLFGRDVHAAPGFVARHVGYMPQTAFALNQLTVGRALYFTAHLRGLTARAARRERDDLLALWDLTDVHRRVSRQLSGGQRRRLQIAVTLAGRPRVVVLDEPTNDLAPQRRRDVWTALRELNRASGTTIVLITHDAAEVEHLVRRVAIMKDGRIVATGDPGHLARDLRRSLRLELRFDPADPVGEPRLPAGVPVWPVEPGRWRAELDPAEVGPVLAGLRLERLTGFRLHSATLEDLYLHHLRDV